MRDDRPVDLGAARQPEWPAWIGCTPASRIAGRLRPPGSKSMLQRALVAAALADGVTRIDVCTTRPFAEDVARAVELVAALDARVEHRATSLVVRGVGLRAGRRLRAVGELDAGESGTLARFATAVLALCGAPGRELRLGARGTLHGRRSDALFAALRGAGATLRANAEGAWPVRIAPTARVPERIELEQPRSSQELSALWLACAAVGTPHDVEVTGPVPSSPYLAITRRILAAFGATVERGAVRGPLVAPTAALAIEPDASSAAVALAAAALTGGELVIDGIPVSSSQGDARIAQHLAAFGYDARHTADGLVVASGAARRAPEDPLRIDLDGEPDLAPVLAIVAASAARGGRTTELTGLATLRGKESDRLAVLEALLDEAGRSGGWTARATKDALSIRPGAERAVDAPFVVDPHGDHRIAFAGALLGLVLPGVRVSSPECVAKSWPSFWLDLEGAGAAVDRG